MKQIELTNKEFLATIAMKENMSRTKFATMMKISFNEADILFMRMTS